MSNFIAQNPEIVGYTLGILLAIIGWFVKRAVDNLTVAIRDLRTGLAEDRAMLANHDGRIEILENEKRS